MAGNDLKTSTAGGELVLRVSSDPANLADVRHSAEDFARRAGLDAEGVEELGLCLNEAMANVTRHAYGGATDRPVVVTVNADAAAVRVQIRDWGNGVNPDALPPRRVDPMVPGGLGLVCLRQMMDRMEFSPQPDGMLLTMTKNKPADNPSAPAIQNTYPQGRQQP